MRDDFSQRVNRALAARAGYQCCRPGCRAPTSGPGLSPAAVINLGKAAHITAASPGGPRYDASLTTEARADIANGIWLCSICADLVDKDTSEFTVEKLLLWKRFAEREASERLGHAVTGERVEGRQLSSEEINILAAAGKAGDIYLLETQQGDLVRAGIEDFYDPDDPAFAAAYVEALESLVERRLVRYKSGQLYNLTGSGFKLARAVVGRADSPTSI
jgi:hypothetical protein